MIRWRRLLSPWVQRARPRETAWREDPTAWDLIRWPRQGALGDCWVMAAMLAVHETDPQFLGAMLDPRADGRVAVAFPPPVRGRGSSSPSAGRSPSVGRARTSVLTRSFPIRPDGRWMAGHEDGSGPGWVGLIEKALALQVAGSYTMLARGFGGIGLRLLTGLPVRLHLRLPSAARIQSWREQRIVMVASTHPGSRRVGTAHGPLPPNHVFAVIGADVRTGHVRLRNPWRPDDVLVIDRRTFRRGFLSLERTAAPLPRPPERSV